MLDELVFLAVMLAGPALGTKCNNKNHDDFNFTCNTLCLISDYLVTIRIKLALMASFYCSYEEKSIL